MIKWDNIYCKMNPAELTTLIIQAAGRRDGREAEQLLKHLQAHKEYKGMNTGRIIAACLQGDPAKVENLLCGQAGFHQAVRVFMESLPINEVRIIAGFGGSDKFTAEERRKVRKKLSNFLKLHG